MNSPPLLVSIIILTIVVLIFVLRDNLRGAIKIKLLTKAIKRNPGDAKAYWRRGEVYCRFYYDCMEDVYGLSISDYSKAIELNPDFAKAYYSRAIAYYHKQEYDKSWQDVIKAETLGQKVAPNFLSKLKKVLGK